MCDCQDSFESIRTPEYFIYSLCSSFFWWTVILIECTFCCGGWKMTWLDFSTFNESLLVLSHSLTSIKALLALSSSTLMFLLERKRFESSANKWKWHNVEQFSKSFIYIRKRRSPRTEPWGTPQIKDWKSELVSAIETNCFWFDKYEANQVLGTPLIP